MNRLEINNNDPVVFVIVRIIVLPVIIMINDALDKFTHIHTHNCLCSFFTVKAAWMQHCARYDFLTFFTVFCNLSFTNI